MATTTIRRSLSWTIIRYITGEILFSFSVAFLFFFFIFFVNQLLLLAQQILTKKVPVQQVALLVLYAIPQIMSLSAPFASLVGVLMTIGRLASDNEALVMLSSGLSYKNIFMPSLFMGIVISLASFFTNDVLMPAGNLQFNKLYRQILVSTPALELESNSVKRYRDTVIVTGNVAGNSIDNIFILDKTSDGERRLIMAKNAQLRDAGKEGLSLDLTNAFIQSSKEVAKFDYDYASSAFLRYWVSQEDLIQSSVSIGPREMSSVDVYKEIVSKRLALRTQLDAQYNKVLKQSLSLEESLRDGPSGAAWNRRGSVETDFAREYAVAADIKKDRSLSQYLLEFYKKFSLPSGAFAFVFLAIPLGLFAKRSGQTVGFFVGVVLSVVYWVFLFGGQTLGLRAGYSPFWTMWFPDILTIGIGLVLCIKRIRK
ncbi:MAG: LptF/LptG family permease [Treponema sp.]|jgi:lipopolysaccharide export system permease protein|nr:LptF/LptG family permease [Treponema sp.]